MRLLLADDHTLFRDTLKQYIERSDPESSVLLARDLHEALELLRDKPELDLILLDLRMPGMDGLDGFMKVKNVCEDTPVALMSGLAEPRDVQEAMEKGAVGYFPKTLSGKALLQAIQLVLTGEKYIPIDHDSSRVMPSYYSDSPQLDSFSPVEQSAFGQERAASDEDNVVNLTGREKDVLEYLVRGAPNKEIADALDLQVVTVKLHVRGICRKLGAQNRTQAALKAKEMGLAN